MHETHVYHFSVRLLDGAKRSNRCLVSEVLGAWLCSARQLCWCLQPEMVNPQNSVTDNFGSAQKLQFLLYSIRACKVVFFGVPLEPINFLTASDCEFSIIRAVSRTDPLGRPGPAQRSAASICSGKLPWVVISKPAMYFFFDGHIDCSQTTDFLFGRDLVGWCVCGIALSASESLKP